MSGENTQALAAQRSWNKIVESLRPVLPTKEGKFDTGLKQVGINYLQGDGEYAKFKTNDRSKFSTYGYDDAERERGTLTFDVSKNRFVDSLGNIAETDRTLYNVTREGQLIIKNSEITTAFNHSSITRDGAVICAGYVTLKDGKITQIDTGSGHYMPTILNLYNAIKELHKDGGQPFDERCRVEPYNMPSMSISEFQNYMKQMVDSPTGSKSRYEQMQQQVRDEAAKMTEKHAQKHVFQASEGGSKPALSGVILATEKLEKEVKDSNRYNFSVTCFDGTYLEAYKQRMGSKYDVKTVTLTTNELFNVLSRDPNNVENMHAMRHLIDLGINKDRDLIPYVLSQKGELLDYCLAPQHIDNTLHRITSQNLCNIDSSRLKVIEGHLKSNLDKPLYMEHLACMVSQNKASPNTVDLLLSEQNIPNLLAFPNAANYLIHVPNCASKIGAYICRDNNTHIDGYLADPKMSNVILSLIYKDPATSLPEYLCREDHGPKYLALLHSAWDAGCFKKLSPPTKQRISNQMIDNIIGDNDRAKNISTVQALYYSNPEIIKAFSDKMDQVVECIPTAFLRDIYPKLQDEAIKQKLCNILIDKLEVGNNDAAATLHQIASQGLLKDKAIEDSLVAWDVKNIDTIEKGSTLPTALAESLKIISEDNRTKLYSAIAIHQNPTNILSMIMRESENRNKQTIDLVYNKICENPDIKVSFTDSYNFPSIIERSNANHDENARALVTKLAATCDVPFDKLAFNPPDPKMQAIYDGEKKSHIERKASALARPARDAVVASDVKNDHSNMPRVAQDTTKHVGGLR